MTRPALAHSGAHELVIGTYSEDRSKERNDIDLRPLIERLATKEPIRTPADVAALAPDNFTPLIGSSGAGYTPETVWYRMPVRVTEAGTEPIDQNRYLEISPAYLNKVDLTMIDDETRILVWHDVVGDHIARNETEARGRLHLSAWPELPAGKYWLVIGVSTNSAQLLGARLKTDTVLIDENVQDTFLYGLYLGVLLIGFMVYFTLGLLSRDRAIIWYGLYIFALFTATVGTSGYAQLLFSGTWQLASDAITGTGTALSIGTSVAMWLYIIELERHNRTAFRALMGYAIIACLGSLTALGHLYIYFVQIFFLPQIGVLLALLGYLVYYGWAKPGMQRLRIYALALGIPAAAAIIYMLMLLGLVPANDFTLNCYQLASLVHLLLLGIAMACRTHDLANQRVAAYRNSARANQLADEQREFITMLSHEFRTPLAIIQRAAEMVSLHMRSDAPEAVTSRISTIRGHASQLSELVNVFLTKETLDSTNFHISPRPTILASFLNDLVKRRQRETPDHDIDLSDTDFTVAMIDRTLIERALSNLIENARKYAPDASVRIGFTHRSDGYVYIRVTDNGPGISQDDLAMVSEAFYRGNTSGSTHGVGLGLHITNRIISAHRGRMTISVGEKGGTTVLIRLPYDRELTNNNIEAAQTSDLDPPAMPGSITGTPS
ncbi:ATP-binding protein [Thalassospira australica]|uniref:sensor histidine kinase n=1 Tax=Thalassospira australica TaxID=1528106 RepID=UPI00384FE581